MTKTIHSKFLDHIIGNLPACFQIYGLLIRNQTVCFGKSGFYLAGSYHIQWQIMKKGKKVWDIWGLLGRIMNASSNAVKIIQYFLGEMFEKIVYCRRGLFKVNRRDCLGSFHLPLCRVNYNFISLSPVYHN